MAVYNIGIRQGFLPDVNAFITEEELLRLIRELVKNDNSESMDLKR